MQTIYSTTNTKRITNDVFFVKTFYIKNIKSIAKHSYSIEEYVICNYLDTDIDVMD